MDIFDDAVYGNRAEYQVYIYGNLSHFDWPSTPLNPSCRTRPCFEMQLAIALIASLAPLTLAKEDHWQKSWQWFKRWQDFDAHIRALTPELESVVGVRKMSRQLFKQGSRVFDNRGTGCTSRYQEMLLRRIRVRKREWQTVRKHTQEGDALPITTGGGQRRKYLTCGDAFLWSADLLAGSE